MGKREKMSRRGPYLARQLSVFRPVGPESQLVNAACFLVLDDDARGNHSNARFILVPATGPYVQQGGVCEGTVLSCTRSACSRGYKQGERGREAPKSLLEVESAQMSAQ